MKREQAKQFLPLIKAFADGKKIQYQDATGQWIDIQDLFFSDQTNYRIFE